VTGSRKVLPRIIQDIDRLTLSSKPKPAAKAQPKSAGTGAAPAEGAGRGRNKRKGKSGKPKTKTAEELDAEMVDYFAPEATGATGEANSAAPSGSAPAAAVQGGEAMVEDEIMVG
jgi:THO complex subunit 4